MIRRLQDSIQKAFEDETITENQYYLLKTKAFSNDYIMQKTLGDEKYFTDNLAEELLEDIEKEITYPYQNKIDDLSNSLNKEKEEKKKVISKIQKIENENQQKKQKEKLQQERYNERAEKTLSIISTVIFGCIILPILSTIVNLSGICQIPFGIIVVSIILILFLPIIGLTITKDNSNIKKSVKKKLINHYKLKDYKKTL